MKLCVEVERGPLYPFLLHRDSARAITYGGAHGDPSPPYTGRSVGGGTCKRERTRSARSHDLLRHRAALSRDRILAERGGTHCVIDHVIQASSAERCACSVYYLTVNTNGLHTFLAYMHGRSICGHDDSFLLIARLILILKGYTRS